MPTQADMIVHRLAALRRELVRRRIGAMLVTDPINVSYLSGFTGDDSWLVVGPGPSCLVTDFRFDEQARRECPWLRLQLFSVCWACTHRRRC
jgi:Xaa-Pro aminopeptidase